MAKTKTLVEEIKHKGVLHRRYETTQFACGTCYTEYDRFQKAKSCAAMKTEKKLFKVGALVTWREPAICHHHERQKSFRIRAKVVKVRRPESPDEEYNIKWLHGTYRNTHVRMLEVAFLCACSKKRTMLLYQAETKRLEEPRKKSSRRKVRKKK